MLKREENIPELRNIKFNRHKKRAKIPKKTLLCMSMHMHFYALISTSYTVNYFIYNIILFSVHGKCPLIEVVVNSIGFEDSHVCPAGEEVIGHCSSKTTASHFYHALF